MGQVLARLDTTRLEAQAQQNEAALEAARAKVLQAQASVQEAEAQLGRLNRVRELSGGKMPSQNDLDTAKANLARYKADEASAKASVAQAQAALDVIRTDITKAVDQVADQRRGPEALGRAGPDRGGAVPVADALHPGRGPDADGIAGGRG